MLQPIVIMRKRAPGVVWRIDEDAFDSPAELLLKRLQSQQVVTENQAIVENVVLSYLKDVEPVSGNEYLAAWDFRDGVDASGRPPRLDSALAPDPLLQGER